MEGGERVRPVARILVAVGLIPFLASATPSAHADDASGAGGTAKGYVDGTGAPTAEASTAASTASPTASRGAPTNCTWQVMNSDDTKTAMYDPNGKRVYSPTGRWYQKVCNGVPVAVNGNFATPESVGADPAVLAQRARESVAIPVPPLATSPPADRTLYTRVPTWLWVDPSWWRGYSATANAGGVSSTVVARPVRAVWTMGDGGQTICKGPGTEWRPGMADAQSTCSYTYKNASAGQRAGTFTMSVDVEFEVSWTSSVGPGGSLARITRSASRTVQVGEIQAVETE
jgi:hypothetical protein